MHQSQQILIRPWPAPIKLHLWNSEQTWFCLTTRCCSCMFSWEKHPEFRGFTPHHPPVLFSSEHLMDHDHRSSFGVELRTARAAHHLQDVGDREVNLGSHHLTPREAHPIKLKLCTSYQWWFAEIGLPPNHNHPFIDGFSLINHPFWGSTVLGTPQMVVNGVIIP